MSSCAVYAVTPWLGPRVFQFRSCFLAVSCWLCRVCGLVAAARILLLVAATPL